VCRVVKKCGEKVKDQGVNEAHGKNEGVYSNGSAAC